jgi:hypothetical protein
MVRCSFHVQGRRAPPGARDARVAAARSATSAPAAPPPGGASVLATTVARPRTLASKPPSPCGKGRAFSTSAQSPRSLGAAKDGRLCSVSKPRTSEASEGDVAVDRGVTLCATRAGSY